MKVVHKRYLRFVVRCNTGYLGDGKEVPLLADALKFEVVNKAERALGAFRKHGWNSMRVEALDPPEIQETVRSY